MGKVSSKTSDKLVQGKIQKLCAQLKDRTLQPALEEAKRVKEEAKVFADGLLQQAHKQKDEIVASAQKEIDMRQKVFYSALENAKNQAVSTLQQEIEKAVFHPEISSLLGEKLEDPGLVKQAIEVLIASSEESGTLKGDKGEKTLMLSKGLSKEAVAKAVSKKVLERLNGKVIQLKEIKGGAMLKIENKNMVLDLSDQAIEQLLFNYMRKEFRDLIFNNKLT